jgi:hypothetical protein
MPRVTADQFVAGPFYQHFNDSSFRRAYLADAHAHGLSGDALFEQARAASLEGARRVHQRKWAQVTADAADGDVDEHTAARMKRAFDDELAASIINIERNYTQHKAQPAFGVAASAGSNAMARMIFGNEAEDEDEEGMNPFDLIMGAGGDDDDGDEFDDDIEVSIGGGGGDDDEDGGSADADGADAEGPFIAGGTGVSGGGMRIGGKQLRAMLMALGGFKRGAAQARAQQQSADDGSTASSSSSSSAQIEEVNEDEEPQQQ